MTACIGGENIRITKVENRSSFKGKTMEFCRGLHASSTYPYRVESTLAWTRYFVIVGYKP